eukprot:COSAG06_NODE_1428_length_9487_cov_195.907861_4_plen_77_part_00
MLYQSRRVHHTYYVCMYYRYAYIIIMYIMYAYYRFSDSEREHLKIPNRSQPVIVGRRHTHGKSKVMHGCAIDCADV